MRRVLRRLAVLAGVWIAMPTRSALAADPVEIDWQAPPGCGSREQVLAEVARLAATPPSEPLRARALVTPRGPVYRVVIELQGALHGVRTLHAGSCDSVARATALIIALAVDPQAATVAVEPSEPSPTRTGNEPPAPARPRDAPAPPPTPTRSLAGSLALGLVFEQALLPDFAVGAEAGAGLRWGFLRSDLAVGVLPRATTELSVRPGARGTFTLGYVALRSCGGHVSEGFSVFGCATLRGSRIWARGDGELESVKQAAHALSLEPGALLRAPGAGGLSSELAANLIVPLSRPRFVILDDDSRLLLFRPSAVGVAFRASVAYEF